MNPFAPGPCVTRSDAPDPDASASEAPAPDASASKSPSDAPSSPTATPSPDATSDKPAETETPEPDETPSASASTTAPATEPAKEPEAGRTATPAPTPTKSETGNPLDPLGVGDAIKDVLDGPDEETAAPEPSESKPATGESATAKPDADKPQASEPKDPAAENPVGDAADRTKDAIKDAADKAGVKVEELGDEVKDSANDAKDADGTDGAADGATEDPVAGAGGKEPFPCPTADPEALANAELEQGIPALPDDPWVLESSMLTLRGLDYKGIVEVRTGSGKIKKVLKFTAVETDIKDLHQKVVGPGGTTMHAQAAKGSTSILRDSTVTMYTEELKGNLFGLIPVTFSPQTPPPLNIPIAMFTDVRVTQAGQFGGTLTIPGLHNFLTG